MAAMRWSLDRSPHRDERVERRSRGASDEDPGRVSGSAASQSCTLAMIVAALSTTAAPGLAERPDRADRAGIATTARASRRM
jgi:hypothetical protein